MGKRAYEGGAYKNAVTALEEAVESLANLNDSGEVRGSSRRARWVPGGGEEAEAARQECQADRAL